MGADVLRSKTPARVRKELAARMMAMNMVRMLMIEAAVRHGEEPCRLSLSHAVRATVAASPKMSEAPTRRLRGLYDEFLAYVAAQTVPDRPGRNEPRKVARERKHYTRLRVKRSEWRRSHAA